MDITLNETKDHLRILHDDEDTYITHLIDVSKGLVQHDINCPLDDLSTDQQKAAKQLVFLIVAQLFNFREVEVNQVKYKIFGYDQLINYLREEVV